MENYKAWFNLIKRDGIPYSHAHWVLTTEQIVEFTDFLSERDYCLIVKPNGGNSYQVYITEKLVPKVWTVCGDHFYKLGYKSEEKTIIRSEFMRSVFPKCEYADPNGIQNCNNYGTHIIFSQSFQVA